MADNILFEAPDEKLARIIVVGVGGGGGNAVNRMIECSIKGVDYIAINTDKQDLDQKSNAETKLPIGGKVTGGLGAGGNPEIGLKAAEESVQEIQQAVRGADMLFIAAGMGGGTGTGAAPVVAKVAKELGILTIAIVTKPFTFEAKKRKTYADQGIGYLKQYVDALVVVPNDKLLQLAEEKTTAIEAFNLANEILKDGVQGITEIITGAGLINVDFADVKSVMSGRGVTHLGIGRASGEGRVRDAVNAAVNSPLLDTSVAGAKYILLRIAGDENLGMLEFSEAADMIESAADGEADVRIGMSIDNSLSDEIVVTVIATGFDEEDELGEGGKDAAQSASDSFQPPKGVPYEDLIASLKKDQETQITEELGSETVAADAAEESDVAEGQDSLLDQLDDSEDVADDGEDEEESGEDFAIPGFLSKQDD